MLHNTGWGKKMIFRIEILALWEVFSVYACNAWLVIILWPHHGMDSISLWLCWGEEAWVALMEDCWVCCLSSSSTERTIYWCFGSVDRCQNPAEKSNQLLHKACQQRKLWITQINNWATTKFFFFFWHCLWFRSDLTKGTVAAHFLHKSVSVDLLWIALPVESNSDSVIGHMSYSNV